MPTSWLTSGLPKIQTDFKALRQSQRTRKLQKDLHESPSTSSSSRSSSFIVTPSSSQPYKAQFSPLNDGNDLYCIGDAAAPTGASSTLTLQPVRTKVAHNSPHHLDRGATRHSKWCVVEQAWHVKVTNAAVNHGYRHPIVSRLSPFEKTGHCTTGRGLSNTQTSSDHSAASVDTQGYVKSVGRHMSPCEDSPTQTTHSSHQPTLGLDRGPRRLSFPKIRRRDAYDSNDAGSSCSHATSQPGSPTAALSRSSSLRSKYKLGSHRFLVSQKVGEGGFGQVYKAIEIHTGHIVAVKTVSRKGLSRSRVNATLKEQKVAQRIAKHQREACNNGGDFVVRMLASFLTLNHFVFVLDYHGAGDLRDVDFPLKTEHARFYIGEMALGLRFIHSLNIVLRDLKPANVLLAFDGHIKLADFGLSAMSEQAIEPISSGPEAERPASVLSFVRTRTISLGSSSLNIPTLDLGNRKRSKTTGHVPKFFKTSSSKRRSSERQRCPMVFCGTPGYISPEGYKGRYGPENDMWALGISLYEFITGENPFDMWGVPTTEIQKKVEDADIYYPEGMPSTTQSIIGQLLKRKWQNRMTIEELMEHPFFQTDDFSWEELQQKKLIPPPLPDIALRRLRQSRVAESQQPQVPLILHLEAEAMRMKDGFVEELGAQEMCDFEMDGLDILPSLKEERRVEGSEDDVWW